MMNRRDLLVTLASGAGAICFLKLDQTCLAVPPNVIHWDGTSQLKSDATAADLRRIADDKSAAREKRAEAIFTLFANHLKPPQGAVAVGQVLTEAAWLKDADMIGVYALAGLVPVQWTLEDTVYCLHLFSDKKESSGWVIYLRLSGGSGRTADEAKAFLRGDKDLKGKPQLLEFALCFPPKKLFGRIERFSEDGIMVFKGD